MKKYYSDKLEVGIDEVARGCLAGPVFVAAVISKDLECEIQNEIKDSQKLSEKKGSIFREYIEENAVGFSVAYKDNNYIDKFNILNSTHKAMMKH